MYEILPLKIVILMDSQRLKWSLGSILLDKCLDF